MLFVAGGRTIKLPAGAASSFAVGSTVLVRRFGNEAWWNALELGPRAEGAPDSIHAHERTIVASDSASDTITLDIGLVIAIEERWGGCGNAPPPPYFLSSSSVLFVPSLSWETDQFHTKF